MDRAAENGYTAQEASKLTGANYHNILYWLRSELIRASMSPDRQPKQRHQALFSFRDVLEIAIVEELRERGAPLRRVRKALTYVRSLPPEYLSLFHIGAALPRDLRGQALYLDVSGDDIYVYKSEREVFSAIKARGQMIIYAVVVGVKQVRDTIIAKTVTIPKRELATANSGK